MPEGFLRRQHYADALERRSIIAAASSTSVRVAAGALLLAVAVLIAAGIGIAVQAAGVHPTRVANGIVDIVLSEIEVPASMAVQQRVHGGFKPAGERSKGQFEGIFRCVARLLQKVQLSNAATSTA